MRRRQRKRLRKLAHGEQTAVLAVLLLQDERGARQGVAHVTGKAVYEIVLAAVRLVGDDDNVAPRGERQVTVLLFPREEFVDGGEYDAARLDAEQAAQVGAALGLHRRLA